MSFSLTILKISDLFFGESFFESLTSFNKWRCECLILTAAAAIGPAKQPLPTSSEPIMY